MADNLNITSGSGLIVGTDQDPITSAHFQRIKLVDGDLNSTNATGVKANPLHTVVQNTGGLVQVSGNISVLNTVNAVSILNTATPGFVSGGISVLNTLAVNVLNTVTSVSLLNTPNFSFVSGGVSVLVTGPFNVNVLTAPASQMSGGVTILSSTYLDVRVFSNTGGTVSLLNTATPGLVTGTVTTVPSGTQAISGGVTLLTGSVTILGALASVTLLNTANTSTVLNTDRVVTVLNTRSLATVSGGVTLLSSAPIIANQGVISYVGCTPTWIYAALSSNNQTVVWKPVATKRFNITDMVINVLSAATVTITQDTAATVTIGKFVLADRGGWNSNLKTPYIATQTNHGLVVTSTAAGTNSYISISGYESV